MHIEVKQLQYKDIKIFMVTLQNLCYNVYSAFQINTDYE